MIMGQKVEAALLRASATPQGFQLKGDVKIGGTPASLEYRKARGEPMPKSAFPARSTRPRATISASISVKPSAAPFRSGSPAASPPASDREGRFDVEADLTPAQIDGLLPGWAKPSGKPARATFMLDDQAAIDPHRGSVDRRRRRRRQGQRSTSTARARCNRPISRLTAFSDGDRTSLKIDRAPDGALRVIMRGEVYDGRGFRQELRPAARRGSRTPSAAPSISTST